MVFFKGKLFRKCGHKVVPEGPKIILVTLEMIMMILKKDENDEDGVGNGREQENCVTAHLKTNLSQA